MGNGNSKEETDPEKLKTLFAKDHQLVEEKVLRKLEATKKLLNTDIVPAAELEAVTREFFVDQRVQVEHWLTRYMRPEDLNHERYAEVIEALKSGLFRQEIWKNQQQIGACILDFISNIDLRFFMQIGLAEAIPDAEHRRIVDRISSTTTSLKSFFSTLKEHYQKQAQRAKEDLKKDYLVSNLKCLQRKDQIFLVNRACDAIYVLAIQISEQLSTKWIYCSVYTDEMKQFWRSHFNQLVRGYIGQNLSDPSGFDGGCCPKAIFNQVQIIKNEMMAGFKGSLAIKNLKNQPLIRQAKQSLEQAAFTKEDLKRQLQSNFSIDVSEQVYVNPAWEELSEYQERTIKEALNTEATGREKMRYEQTVGVLRRCIENMRSVLSESKVQGEDFMKLIGHQMVGIPEQSFHVLQNIIMRSILLASAYLHRPEERKTLVYGLKTILGQSEMDEPESGEPFFLMSQQAQKAHEEAQTALWDNQLPCELNYEQAVLLALSTYITCSNLSLMLQRMVDSQAEVKPQIADFGTRNAIASGLKCLHSKLGFVRTSFILDLADAVLGEIVLKANKECCGVSMRSRYVHIDMNHSLSVLRGLPGNQAAETFDLFDAEYEYPVTEGSRLANLEAAKTLQSLFNEVKQLKFEPLISSGSQQNKCEGSLSKLLVMHGFLSEGKNFQDEYQDFADAFSNVEGLALRWPSSSKAGVAADLGVVGLSFFTGPLALAGIVLLDAFRWSQRSPQSPPPNDELIEADGTANWDWRNELGGAVIFQQRKKNDHGIDHFVNAGLYLVKRNFKKASTVITGVQGWYNLFGNSFDFSKQMTHKVAHCLALTLSRLRLMNSCTLHLKGFSLGTIVTLATLEYLYDLDPDFCIGDVLLVGSVFPLEAFYQKAHIYIGHRSALGGVLTIAYSGSDGWVGFDRWVMDPLRGRGCPQKLGNFPIDFERVVRSLLKNDPGCKSMTENQVRRFAKSRLRSIHVHDIATDHNEIFDNAGKIAHRTDFIHRL